jgi:hypothetical protein
LPTTSCVICSRLARPSSVTASWMLSTSLPYDEKQGTSKGGLFCAVEQPRPQAGGIRKLFVADLIERGEEALIRHKRRVSSCGRTFGSTATQRIDTWLAVQLPRSP